jgi:hypothetical protein
MGVGEQPPASCWEKQPGFAPPSPAVATGGDWSGGVAEKFFLFENIIPSSFLLLFQFSDWRPSRPFLNMDSNHVLIWLSYMDGMNL